MRPNIKILYTFEPFVGKHLKCKSWVRVASKNRTTGSLFREEVQTHLLYGRYLLHVTSKLHHV